MGWTDSSDDETQFAPALKLEREVAGPFAVWNRKIARQPNDIKSCCRRNRRRTAYRRAGEFFFVRASFLFLHLEHRHVLGPTCFVTVQFFSSENRLWKYSLEGKKFCFQALNSRVVPLTFISFRKLFLSFKHRQFI